MVTESHSQWIHVIIICLAMQWNLHYCSYYEYDCCGCAATVSKLLLFEPLRTKRPRGQFLLLLQLPLQIRKCNPGEFELEFSKYPELRRSGFIWIC